MYPLRRTGRGGGVFCSTIRIIIPLEKKWAYGAEGWANRVLIRQEASGLVGTRQG